MERYFLHNMTATAHFRTLLGLLLSCAFLWSSLCCESFALASEMQAEMSKVQASGTHAKTSTPQHCHDVPVSMDAASMDAASTRGKSTDAGAQDKDCDCFYPKKSLTVSTLSDSVLAVSLAEAYTLLSPLQSPATSVWAIPILQRGPRPPPDLMGPPVFYASTVLLI